MKFQNPSMHNSKVRLCIKVCNIKMPKMTKGYNSRSTFQNLFDSSLPTYSSNFKALGSTVYEILC